MSKNGTCSIQKAVDLNNKDHLRFIFGTRKKSIKSRKNGWIHAKRLKTKRKKQNALRHLFSKETTSHVFI